MTWTWQRCGAPSRTSLGVADVHDLHVWSLTSGMNALSVHVVAADGSDAKTLLNEGR